MDGESLHGDLEGRRREVLGKPSAIGVVAATGGPGRVVAERVLGQPVENIRRDTAHAARPNPADRVAGRWLVVVKADCLRNLILVGIGSLDFALGGTNDQIPPS